MSDGHVERWDTNSLLEHALQDRYPPRLSSEFEIPSEDERERYGVEDEGRAPAGITTINGNERSRLDSWSERSHVLDHGYQPRVSTVRDCGGAPLELKRCAEFRRIDDGWPRGTGTRRIRGVNGAHAQCRSVGLLTSQLRRCTRHESKIRCEHADEP